ncbi:MAG TPA: glutamine amidotransferase [Rhodanobacteraceae bacterium]
MMRPLLIIQTGEAPQPIFERLGGFAQWFRSSMRLRPDQVRVVRVDAGGKLPQPKTVAGAVITGSGAMVTDRERWSEDTGAWLRSAMDAELPLFGVCYGHQLMAHAFGGTVGWLPSGREIGTQPIMRNDRSDALMDGMPANFPAHTTHRQSVIEAPRGARLLASSAADPHQILRYAPNAISTQFHPEFGMRAMRAYLRSREEALVEEGHDVAALEGEVAATPDARALLRRFARAALGH